MSVHLVGGGRAENYDGEVFREFLSEATARALGGSRILPRIGIVLVMEQLDDTIVAAYTSVLARVTEFEPVVTAVLEGEQLESSALSHIDGLLIGGGLTPAYLEAVQPIVDEIRLLVADGLPYLGFSAGAAIASEQSILGGWRIGDVEVCPEDAGEELDEVTVEEGLGLVDLAVDVHAAQWGTLARLIAATEAGLVDGGVAIDEFTVLIVGDEGFRVVGSGSVWRVMPHEDGVIVSTLGA